MRTKLYYVFSIIYLSALPLSSLKAQSFEEYKKQQEQAFKSYKTDREKQIKALQTQFDEYVKKRDKEFGEYLKKRWREFQSFKGIKPKKEPKPLVPPTVKPENEVVRDKVPEQISTIPPREIPVAPPLGLKPFVPRIKKIEPEKFPRNEVAINFYGSEVFIEYDKNLIKKFSGPINETGFSNYWNLQSKINYGDLLDQLLVYRKQMNLNDWAYYDMVRGVSKKICLDDNSANMVTWFILNKSGYDARIGYGENKIFLMLPSVNEIYRYSYIKKDGVKYYIMNNGSGRLYTYDKSFPDAKRAFDLNFYHPVMLGESTKQRELTYDYKGQPIKLMLDYNQNIIDFYGNYPQADFKIYFDASVSAEAKESLAKALYPYINGKNDKDAVQFLLSFVQKAFKYKTDDDQFGKEKYFFPEEALHYPFCDCEDRSVLFTYLVKTLLGLDVVGLNYPGHMATAVLFPGEVHGNYVLFKKEKYTVCDPTYIGASIGMSMPKFKSAPVKIIEIDNSYGKGFKEQKIWERILAAGGYRGDTKQDIIINDKNEVFLIGNYSNTLKLGTNILESTQGNRNVFVAKITDKGGIDWVKGFGGPGNDISYGLKQDETGNLFVFGLFTKTAQFGSFNLTSKAGKNDIFLLKMNEEGKVLWAHKTGLDTLDSHKDLTFSTLFKQDGTMLSSKIYPDTEGMENTGISIAKNGEILIASSLNSMGGINSNKSINTNSVETFDYKSFLKNENSRLISQNYDKAAAGLFSVISYIKTNGHSISGCQAQEVLDMNNPNFKKSSPSIYKSIGRINFLQNSDGIIELCTIDKKPVSFDLMQIKTNSRIKAVDLPGGNSRLDVLNGIRVGKAFIWFNLNHITLFKTSGDLLFDYDKDHTQKKFNLASDILN